MNFSEFISERVNPETTSTLLSLCANLLAIWSFLPEPEPDAAYNDDGTVMLAWDDTVNHLELEINGDAVELFYVDRHTGYCIDLDSTRTADFFELIKVLGVFSKEQYA